MADMTLEQVLFEARLVANNGCVSITRKNCAEWADAIDAAIKQRERDEKEAARYRWLSDQWMNTDSAEWLEPIMHAETYAEMDSAIDAAMARESGR